MTADIYPLAMPAHVAVILAARAEGSLAYSGPSIRPVRLVATNLIGELEAHLEGGDSANQMATLACMAPPLRAAG